MREKLKDAIDELAYGDLVTLVVGERELIGMYIGVRGKFYYFLCPNGEALEVTRKEILDLYIMSGDAVEEIEEMSSKFFGELLRLEIIDHYGKLKDPNRIQLRTTKETINIFDTHVKLKLSVNNVVLDSGIEMMADSEGNISIKLDGGKFDYEYFEDVYYNIKIDNGVKDKLDKDKAKEKEFKSTVPYAVYKEALDKIKKLEADIKVYKEALRHALKD